MSHRGRRSTPRREERLQQGSTILGEHARRNLDAVIQLGGREQFEARTKRASFRIIGAVHQPWDARLHHRACAHAAGFQRNVKSSVGESIISEESRSLADGHNFRVRRRVVIANGAIAGAGEHFVLVSENSPNGNFACSCASLRFGYR